MLLNSGSNSYVEASYSCIALDKIIIIEIDLKLNCFHGSLIKKIDNFLRKKKDNVFFFFLENKKITFKFIEIALFKFNWKKNVEINENEKEIKCFCLQIGRQFCNKLFKILMFVLAHNLCGRVSRLGPQLAGIVRFGLCLTDLFNLTSGRDVSHMCLISLSPRHVY